MKNTNSHPIALKAKESSASHKSELSDAITQQPGSSKKTNSSIISGPKSKTSRRVSGINDVHVDKYKSKGLKQAIFGGSSYSKALLRGEDDKRTSVQLECLRHLEGANRLFFRKCKKLPPELQTFNVHNKRGIWNSAGRVVYYTGQRKICICNRCYYSDFIHEVVDYSGNTVIVSKGRQVLFGMSSNVEIFLEGTKLLGTMHQSCLSSTYKIKDSSGRLVYKIQAPCFAPCAPFVFWCCKENFELCMDDGVTEIGKITKSWGSSALSEFRHCLGIEMERVDDLRVKALLLGCFFLIEFQYYKCGGNGPIFFLLMVIILVGFMVAIQCLGYCPTFSREEHIEKV